MVKVGEKICPKCGGKLDHYDTVRRWMLGKDRVRTTLYLDRDYCPECGSYHREIPDAIYPYKQYRADIVDGVIKELITVDTTGYEDYPCESTMERWRTRNLHSLL